MGSLTREVALERELNETQEKLAKMKVEKEQLEHSVRVRKQAVSVIDQLVDCLLIDPWCNFAALTGVATATD